MTLCLCIAAVRGEAQYTTDMVEVFVDQACNPPEAIEMVLEETDFAFLVERAGGSTWRGKSPKSFDPDDARASLRIAGARTACYKAKRVKDPTQKNSYMARFIFDCPDEPGRSVTVGTIPKIPLAYVRFMPRTPVFPDSRDCTQWSALNGSGTIAAVQLGTERLRLQIGRTAAEQNAPGLLVDDAVTERATRHGGALKKYDLLTLFDRQRAATPAGLSSNAYDIDRRQLEATKLETLTLKVE